MPLAEFSDVYSVNFNLFFSSFCLGFLAWGDTGFM